jgi:hypothetical protein
MVLFDFSECPTIVADFQYAGVVLHRVTPELIQDDSKSTSNFYSNTTDIETLYCIQYRSDHILIYQASKRKEMVKMISY